MDVPLPTGDALGQPTRAQIFAFLVDKRAPASTGEVAAHFGLHPNGVRRHLERLLEGGFVSRDRVRGGQGRPRDSWTISADALPGGQPPQAYAELASWLARATPATQTRLLEVDRTGQEIGRELGSGGCEDPVEGFRQTIAALGFQPAMDVRAGGGFDCVLRNCPYRDAAKQNPEVVCVLHRGITAGLLAELDPEAELVGFEAHDADRADCLVSVARPLAPAD